MNDVTVRIDGVSIGGLIDAGYEVNYPYSPQTGVNSSLPEYVITVSFRPVTGTQRPVLQKISNSCIQIIDPMRTVTIDGCKTWRYSCITDKDGMIETVKLIGYRLSLS